MKKTKQKGQKMKKMVLGIIAASLVVTAASASTGISTSKSAADMQKGVRIGIGMDVLASNVQSIHNFKKISNENPDGANTYSETAYVSKSAEETYLSISKSFKVNSLTTGFSKDFAKNANLEVRASVLLPVDGNNRFKAKIGLRGYYDLTTVTKYAPKNGNVFVGTYFIYGQNGTVNFNTTGTGTNPEGTTTTKDGTAKGDIKKESGIGTEVGYRLYNIADAKNLDLSFSTGFEFSHYDIKTKSNSNAGASHTNYNFNEYGLKMGVELSYKF